MKSFVSKLSDALGEEYETEVWLDYSKNCNYLDINTYEEIVNEYNEVRKMLISIMNNLDKFCKPFLHFHSTLITHYSPLIAHLPLFPSSK
ncbi:MAG: four helix bundle protein [Candidatus Atribacteria bacterium]|nr:four helix bundle protein [Candidatus Atribacteria bacterium]